jgi:hypothetical protein
MNGKSPFHSNVDRFLLKLQKNCVEVGGIEARVESTSTTKDEHNSSTTEE